MNHSGLPIQEAIDEEQDNLLTNQADEWFKTLIQESQYIGDVYSISYETANVLVHDHFRQEVGGIPSLSFLIATRVKPDETEIDYKLEDSSVILLRVMDAVPLPTSNEAERIRVESAEEVSGEPSRHWDLDAMDIQTSQKLSFAGVGCRVIGTFFLDLVGDDPPILAPRFGSDLSNYYPNRGLAVYKPNDNSLKKIVNYQDVDRLEDLTDQNQTRVPIGEVRYASTNRAFQGISNVEVSISPADMLEQKTALFGMTRTGKSNTTKIIAKSVFDLRFDSNNPLHIGQIIFDPNGEYANENVQDADNEKNPSALKNVWQSNKEGKREDVVTYGIHPHDNDPKRNLMLLNFYEEDNLQKGKEIIDGFLTEDSIYIRNFRQIVFERPDPNDHSATTRFKRRVLIYRALLAKAGFTPPDNLLPDTNGLFNGRLLQQMRDNNGNRSADYNSASAILGKTNPTWDEIHTAFLHLSHFVSESGSGYTDFENWYVNDRPRASGDTWADEDLKKILEMFRRPNGAQLIGQARRQHTNTTTKDYAVEIYKHLVKGRLVIVDQSSGDPKVNQSSADRIMWYIFRENQRKFRDSHDPTNILIYIEEAHNLLPSGSDLDPENVWVRTAKEGAKFRLGMVYVTQEVSSIQKNILKNTANWFIGHLNNTDETAELRKFYDFADFEKSILRAQDRGFLRVKTLSNLFVVPVQIKKFEV